MTSHRDLLTAPITVKGVSQNESGPPPVQPLYFLQEDLSRSEYFQAYPSTERDLGSIAMDHRALRHHSFTSSSGKEQSAIQQ
jgi:hypothetical protein